MMKSNLEKLRDMLDKLKLVKEQLDTPLGTPLDILRMETGISQATNDLTAMRESIEKFASDEAAALNLQIQFQPIIDNAPTAIIGITEGGIILVWNQEATRLFGWSAEEVLGAKLEQYIIPERYRELHAAGLARAKLNIEGMYFYQLLKTPALGKARNEFEIIMAICPAQIGKDLLFFAFIVDPANPPAIIELETLFKDRFKANVSV